MRLGIDGVQRQGRDRKLGKQILQLTAANAGQFEGHGGSTYGYQSRAFYFPAKHTAIVAIVNQGNGDPNPIIDGAIAALFP